MWQLLAPVIDSVAGVFTKRTERKAAKDSLKSKAVLSRLDSETQITLTDAEWEIAKVNAENSSWKDEWITIVMTAPIVLVIVGSVVAGFGYGSEMVDGAVAGIATLNDAGVPVGQLMTATVFAGLGLKLWRG